MANPSVTNTFTNGSTADATQVNQNYTDLINGATDGTKDYNINVFTANGTSNLKGNVTLGLSSSNNLTINAALAASLVMSANNSWDIGSAGIGLASVYLGAAGGFTTRVLSGATASWSLTLPTGAGTSGYVLQTNGSGVTSWVPVRRSPSDEQNYSLSTSVGSNAMTISLNQADGTAPSATNPATIVFRNSTVTTGTPVERTVTSAISVVIPSGATLAAASGHDDYIYVYAMDNAGTVELAVCGTRFFGDGAVQSSTALTSGSTASNVLYATANRSNVPIRFIGRVQSNQTVAGTYAANATEIAINHNLVPIITEWRNDLTFTPTNFGTVTNSNFWWRRVGDTMEVRGGFQAGTAAAATAYIALPLNIDTAKLGTGTSDQIMGWYAIGAGRTIWSNSDGGPMFYDGSTNNQIYLTTTSNGSPPQGLSKLNASSATGSNIEVMINFSIPISGWAATR